MRVVFALALLGLILSAAAHVSTYFGFDPEGKFPYIWVLHIGIFVLGVPAISIMKTLAPSKEGSSQLLTYIPLWMKLAAVALGAYAGANFAAFIFLMSSGSPAEEHGRYFLEEHGRVIRQITEQEFHRYQAYEVRGFSGHWMLFYFGAMTAMVSAMSHRRRMADEHPSEASIARSQGGMTLWVHSVCATLVTAAGFFFGPAVVLVVLLAFRLKIDLLTGLIWLASPWPGMLVANRFLRRSWPAACPRCGGRAYWVSGRGIHHRCTDCAWEG